VRGHIRLINNDELVCIGGYNLLQFSDPFLGPSSVLILRLSADEDVTAVGLHGELPGNLLKMVCSL